MVAEPPALAQAPLASPPTSAPTSAEAGIHRFAFVLHPLELGAIHRDPGSRRSRRAPKD